MKIIFLIIIFISLINSKEIIKILKCVKTFQKYIYDDLIDHNKLLDKINKWLNDGNYNIKNIYSETHNHYYIGLIENIFVYFEMEIYKEIDINKTCKDY